MLKAALASLFALAVAAPSPTFVPPATGPGTRFYAGPPPARYIREDIVPVMFIDPAKLQEACGTTAPPGLVLMACTRTLKTGVKVVIMPHPAAAMDFDPYALVLAHELGHVAGWSGEHPL